MSDDTDYPTGALSDPAANREPADFEDPEDFEAADEPVVDPDALPPSDLQDDGNRIEAHLADEPDDEDTDPGSTDVRAER